ncbi:VC1465 family Xer recombination activation factor [Arenimonas composti]|uniref:VC1465 family Xer recombination activation factor n=1 Tax=Arenimonas composti TaxID=370776 RepID=UPI0005C2577A
MRTTKAKPARAGKAGKRPRSRAVTADRFQTARLTACLSVPATAKLLHVTERTVHNWESGRSRVPYAAYKLLRVLRGFDLGHPAWAGFRLDGPTLWTPEGHAFRPDHLTWWSLTCRMADEFRRVLARQRAGLLPSPDASATLAAPPVPAAAEPPPPEGVSNPQSPLEELPAPHPAGVSILPQCSMRRAPSSNHGVKSCGALLRKRGQSPEFSGVQP